MRLAAAALLSALLLLGAGSAQAVPGNLDPSFGSGGVAATRIGSSSSAQALMLQPDGKIVEAGWSVEGPDGVFALARYAPDGTLDRSFGSNGTTTTAWGTHAQGEAVALQPDGKIVLAGQIFYQAKFALARYTPDGSLDPSFAGNGKQTFPVGEASGAAAVAVQPDGKIVVAGYSSNDASSVIALARLKPNGLPDPGFGTDGLTTTQVGLASGRRRSCCSATARSSSADSARAAVIPRPLSSATTPAALSTEASVPVGSQRSKAARSTPRRMRSRSSRTGRSSSPATTAAAACCSPATRRAERSTRASAPAEEY